ncbi:MerR family transcriptional regulator [Nocardia sp. CDC160]|uniref:MerR family transcriptional regulator n=1 Tax=Nocardia sp. CDC160 TaxID=3112166 RepID=UPI002DC032A6|nr:MerR family transcriptional regulator [Nocardia sp. CDC160]MEC3918395.1 MerR family transcriptional regulator [Nocardia sp. CDC160]
MAETEFTIDELARETGMTVRSLRAYHERGVLPPPYLKGRTGFYNQEHVNRLQMISRLLDRGIKLHGIRELLEAWDRGEDLGDVLGVEETPEPGTEQTARLTGREATPARRIPATHLAERYSEVPNGLARIVAAGLYEPVDVATYRERNPRLVALTEQLVTAGIPRTRALDEVERLRATCEHIARRFADLAESTPAALRTLPGQAAADLIDEFLTRYLDSTPRELSRPYDSP